MSSWRELALVGCALLLPIPLLAVGGGMAPLLPSVVERSIASLLPGATGTSEDAAASGRASVHVPRAGVRDRSGSVSLAPGNLGTSLARDTNEAESTPGPGGAGDASGGAAPSGGGASKPTADDEPPAGEETPSSTPSEPETHAAGTSRSSDTAAGVQVTLSAREASGALSADADNVTLNTQASGQSDDPGGSLGVTSADDSKIEVAAPELPAPELPVP